MSEIYDRYGRRLYTIPQLADVLEVSKGAVEKARQRGSLKVECAEPLDSRTPLFYGPGAQQETPVPWDMREHQRWLCWYGDARPQRPGGGLASVTTPADWCTYEEALEGGNVGYVLAGEGRYDICCLDLDDCLQADGEPFEEIANLLRMVGPTWTEVSPSGEGLHVWGYAEVPKGRRTTFFGHRVEVYGTGRFIRCTGETWPGSPAELTDLTAVIAAVLSPSTN